MGVPSQWSDTQPVPRRHAPLLGEHSVEVLREIGLTDAEIHHLMDLGISSAPKSAGFSPQGQSVQPNDTP
jgi:hypothetical protein